MNEKLRGLLTGLIGGLISVICCIVPLFLLLLGIWNLGLIASMGAYRIYFIFLGLLFIILAVAIHIRMRRKRCKCSSIQMLRQESKFVFTALALFLIIFGVINFLILPYATTIISAKSNVYEKTGSLKQLKLKIDGMTCEGCAVAIESTLKSMKGVIDAKVSFAEGTATVLYDPSIISPQQIVDNIPKPYLVKIISSVRG